MYNPKIEQIGKLAEAKTILNGFSDDFVLSYDPEDELDAQLKQMIDLILEGFTSVYEEMKRRI